MFAVIKKMFLASLVVLTVLTTGAWQSNPIAAAESQQPGSVETPLFPGLTWSSLGSSNQDIRINVNGDSVSLPGVRYEAKERFVSSLPQDVLNFYSNEQLAKSGWVSYDSFNTAGGMHLVFEQESGIYLSVEFVTCADEPSSICIAVWQSEQTDAAAIAALSTSEPNDVAEVVGAFGKISPANGASNVNPTNAVLSWEAYSPTPDKYSYCLNIGSACANNDPDWTTSFSTSVTLTNLAYNTTYHWQVRAVTCVTCVPKTFVYANGGTAWTFTTRPSSQAMIVGNAGVAGAVLSYTDVTVRTVTANSTGAYSITVPLNWSGTITPSKAGYFFSPRNASFTNLTAPQTIQNFIATPAYFISGNVGLPSVTLSYTETTPQTVLSDALGNYSIPVPPGWSGTVTPSRTGYLFSPTSKTYTNVLSNQTGQNYTPYTFVDVTPSHPFFRYIQAFANRGITVGCSQSPRLYCPNDNVTRGEMAVFIERAMGNFNPPASAVHPFEDVPYTGLEHFTNFIEEFYRDGITAGCQQSPLRYCPADNVNRGEMAVFIERSIGHFNPPTNAVHPFEDVPYAGMEPFTNFIEQLYFDGITVGCQQSPLRYCPQNNVTRAEMAVFIVRAFNIPLP